MIRAPVNPALVTWSRERARFTLDDLIQRFPKLIEWESGARQPTFKQADAFAAAVHVPVGYLFLTDPPVESIPLLDYRTIAGTPVGDPSPDLLDVIRACEERQSWYRNYSRIEGLDPLSFVGSATPNHSTTEIAHDMRETLGFSVQARRSCPTWTESLRMFIGAADSAGILVMVSGIVGSNTHRGLDPDEFRGFALSDSYAPLVFVNGADTKSAQMFTLAHEIAHLWLDATALSDCQAAPAVGLGRDERWCNAVAAEFLVPLVALRRELRAAESLPTALRRLTRVFKVSSLVLLRRLLDVGWLNRSRFDSAWIEEKERLRSLAQSRGGGGDFYRTTISRVGRTFAKALVASTLEGQTLYRDAYRMLGVRSTSSFEELTNQVTSIP